jgi:hypothetical protein
MASGKGTRGWRAGGKTEGGTWDRAVKAASTCLPTTTDKLTQIRTNTDTSYTDADKRLTQLP